MKKVLFSIAAILSASLLFIIITAQKLPTNKKYYYAFNEKIYLDDVPDKYLIKFRDKVKTKKNIALLKSELVNQNNVQLQNDTIATIDIKDYKNGINDLLKDKMADIDIIRPAYKYQNQLMYYGCEILVEPKDGLSINDVISRTGLSSIRKIRGGKFFSILEIDSAFDACDIANQIQESGLVNFCHPNFLRPITKYQVIPNDAYFNNQFYLQNTGQVFNSIENHSGSPGADINAPWAWTRTIGTSNIVVAVIDEGVTPDHPDLPNSRQVRLNGSNFSDGDPNDPSALVSYHANHGNACAGIIAATQNNYEGVSGIAPGVRIMPIRLFHGNFNSEYFYQSDSNVAAAIDFAWQNGADIISNSWGYQGIDNPNYVPAIVSALYRAVTQGRNGLGSIVVFGVGNTASHYATGNNGVVSFPSNVLINGVIKVGASDRNDYQADYSPTSNSASPNNQIIDLVAPSNKAFPASLNGIPGESSEVFAIDIPGLSGYNQWNDPNLPIAPVGQISPNNGTNYLSYTQRMGGTSASCPQVAAVAALILSLNNNLTQQQVFNIITKSAEKVGGYSYDANGWSAELGNGRLNAYAALNSIPNLFPISGNDVICSNGTVTYTLPSLPAGSTIVWSSSNNNIATISSSGIASWVSSGTVTFKATCNIPNRGGTAVSEKTVTVGDAIFANYSIIGDNSVCGTSNFYSIANLPIGASVTWSAFPTGIVIINNPTATQTQIKSISSGVITLTANISIGCSGSINKANISVTGPPNIDCQTIGNGTCNQVNTLCSSQLNTWRYFSIPNYSPPGVTGFQLFVTGSSYFSNGTNTKTITTAYWDTHDIGVFVKGNCDVTVRPFNNCGTSTYAPYDVSFRVLTAGCYSSYLVSPNPTSSIVSISPDPQSATIKNKIDNIYFTEIEIVDKLGNFKKRIKFPSTANRTTIDLSFLPTDTYIIRIFTGGIWEDHKILVVK